MQVIPRSCNSEQKIYISLFGLSTSVTLINEVINYLQTDYRIIITIMYTHLCIVKQ